MEDVVGRVRALITELKLKGGPTVSPAEIRDHIAQQLNISETAAGELIVQSALVDVQSKQRDVL
jgi:hypothetical protein